MTFSLTPEGAPFADLERFVSRLKNPGGGELRKVADAIALGFQANFSAEGSAGGRWASLAPSTVKDRQQKGYAGAHPILVRSGRMRASFVQRGAADHVEQTTTTADGWEVAVGSQSEVAIFHEHGTSRMPARPISPLTDEAQSRIASTVEFVIREIERQTLGR